VAPAVPAREHTEYQGRGDPRQTLHLDLPLLWMELRVAIVMFPSPFRLLAEHHSRPLRRKRDRDAFEPEPGTSVDIPNERFRVGLEDAEQGLVCGHDGRVDEADCLSLVRHLGGSCPEAVGPGSQVADGSARLIVLDEVGRRLLRVPWCHRTDPTPEGRCANRVFPYVLVSSPPGRAPIRAPSSARERMPSLR